MVAPQISLPIVVGGALLDSINPCVIGVLILLMTILLKSRQKSKILTYGITYTIGVYITYLLGGLTLLSIFNVARDIQILSQLLYVAIGAFTMVAGFLEVKDFFWYGRWFSLAIPQRFVSTIETKVKTVHTNYLAALFFGFIVTLIELPCTGAPYLAVLALMTQIDFGTALSYLLLYNLIFIAPLILIIYLVYTGFGLKRLESLRQEHRGKMRLGMGLFLLALGIWIIVTVEDVFVPLTLFTISMIISMAILQKYIIK